MVYEVLECKGVTGLTIGNGLVLKPGQTFDEKTWSYGSEALAIACDNKRCKKLSEKEVKKSDAKKEA